MASIPDRSINDISKSIEREKFSKLDKLKFTELKDTDNKV